MEKDDEKKEPEGLEAPLQNQCMITPQGVMTVQIFLNDEAGLAKALGSLELAKDLAKDFCMKRAMMEASGRPNLIKPGLVH